MLQASATFRPYDAPYADMLVEKAKLSIAVLDTHPDAVIPEMSAFRTGAYIGQTDGNPFHDEGARLWAYVELWHATGNTTALALAENLMRSSALDSSPTCLQILDPSSNCLVASEVDWRSLRNLGLFRYLLPAAEAAGDRNATLVAAAKSQLAALAHKFAITTEAHPHGKPVGDHTKWGINGEITRTGLFMEVAARVAEADGSADEARRYRSGALSCLDHVLGRNEHSKSYVTKVGKEGPSRLHHRPSCAMCRDHLGAGHTLMPLFPLVPLSPSPRPLCSLNFLDVWPGLMAGGQNPVWRESWLSYTTNENAINYNAGLTYILSMFARAPAP